MPSVFTRVPFSETITFVLFTVGSQKKNLDIDGQFKCLKEKDKNEWMFYTDLNRLSRRRIGHFILW